jgi:DNA topoisomerase-1
VPLGVPCPKCGGDIVEVRSKKRGAKSFYGCTRYAATPSCDFKLWQKPVNLPCPVCNHPFLTIGGGAKNPKLVCGRGKDCGYSRPLEDGVLDANGAVLPVEGSDGEQSSEAPKRVGGRDSAAVVAP